ncbi:Wadjet anti-phage system protein JetD domain-containing protein [Sporosarcina siberiensis]|uniref:Wadjet anti-phage system protein JetD domain-containing protein n=1 Tax=Sporosarcina siberiensis TaxID=1365606 RepID=A0ABW4SDL4_9BACL
MEDQLNRLARWSKVMISLEELSAIFYKKDQTYEELAARILELENEQILQPVKAAGQTMRTPSIAHRYRIDKSKIQDDFYGQLHRYNEQFHPAIRLDRYYSLTADIFSGDLPFIKQIHTYLTNYGLPKDAVPAPERSVELVGDEKWIDESGGRALLERIALWDLMKIIPVSDPLMMAFNVQSVHNPGQFHLIVENKTTYQALLPVLPETVFSTLIYGCGNKIVKSIEQFDWQYPIGTANHTFYYFGDVDRSGLTIWHLLNGKRTVLPAIPFYEACLCKEPFQGETNQRRDIEAVQRFVAAMPSAKSIQTLLDGGFYYPQEIVKSAELGKIWRDWSWNLINGKG